MFTRSIRWRLQLWLAFLLLCLLSGFGFTSFQLNRLNRFRQIDETLERRVAAVSTDVRVPPFVRLPGGPPPEGGPDHPPPDIGRGRGGPGRGHEFDRRPGRFDLDAKDRPFVFSGRTLSLFDEGDTNGFYYAIWSPGGVLLKASTNAPLTLEKPVRAEADMGVHIRTTDAHREAFQFTELGDCVLVGRSVTADLEALRRFAWLLVAVGAAVLAVGLGGGWVLGNRALRPVDNISAAASRISSGNLSERIDVAETDSELGRLAGVLNSTFARLEAAFAQQKQFTADASHELRTPLAVMITEAQAALARERSPEEYRETVAACLETAQQMRRLTQSLLELARFDAGQVAVERSPFNLAEQAGACIELIKPLAEKRGIQIACDLQPAPIKGDPDRLAQVLVNLLTNAVEYNRLDGNIEVATGVHNGTATVKVSDTGRGISAQDLPHVFERFYRADKSRARAQGHYGLGLAICKAIVEAHGGTITLSSQPGVGTVFTVSLPA